MADTPDRRPDDDFDPYAGLPPEVAELLRSLTGGNLDPELSSMLEGLGLDKIPPHMMAMVAQQVQAMMAPGNDDPVDAERATTTARAVAATAGDPVVPASAARAVVDAVALARLWLDAVTDFGGPSGDGHAWSRAEWVEATMPTWVGLVAPIAQGVTSAITTAMSGQLDELRGMGDLPEGLLPEGADLSAMSEAMLPMLTRMSAAMFSLQTGQAIGHLATDVLTGTEIGLPLVPGHAVALLPTNIEAFAEGLDIPIDEIRLHLAVRESARARLFTSVPWLTSALTAAVRDYARDIRVDTDGIESAMSGLDVSDPEQLQSALKEKLFTPTPSAAQLAALARLETLLALVEGWVEHVTARATAHQLPNGAALSETLRRRRATGGPAELTFSSLVGLELRPRRLRDAANLFAALEDRLGAEGRDRAWAVPDLAPGTADLDDVMGYVERAAAGPQSDAMDAALEELLRGED